MDKLTPKETSKGAEEIVLTQIKQDFITPANAIFDYVDMVEKVLDDAHLQSEDEIEQIKSSCSKLIDFNISNIASAPMPAVKASSPNSS